MADDQNTPPRSSRGEPGPEDETQRIPAQPQSGATDEQSPGKPARAWRGRSIGVPVAAAVAAGLVVLSGVGGYALGVVTSDGRDFDRVSFQRGGFPQHGRGGFGHDGDGRGGFPGPPPGMDGQTPPGLDDPGGSTEDSGTTT